MAMALVTYRLENGTIAEPHIGIGGAESHARRFSEAERTACGENRLDAEAFVEAAERAAAMCDPIEDINNTIAYRRGFVRTMVLRALENAA